jgi:hypothetical protein
MLVSVVAPSVGGGAIGSFDSVAGEPAAELDVPVAAADEVVAARLGEEPEPGVIWGPTLGPCGGAIVEKVVGALALTWNVGALDSTVGSGAVVTTVGADVTTSVVVVEVTAVVVVPTVVVWAGSIIVVACGATFAVAAPDWIVVGAEGEVILALLGALICAGAVAGAGLGAGALGVTDAWLGAELGVAGA